MRFQYEPRGGDYPSSYGIERWISWDPQETDGIIEVPEDHPRYDEIVDRLKYEGHTPLEETDASGDPVEAFSEEDIVTMDYRELQSIAAEYDDIQGNATKDELEEALIKKIRSRG